MHGGTRVIPYKILEVIYFTYRCNRAPSACLGEVHDGLWAHGTNLDDQWSLDSRSPQTPVCSSAPNDDRASQNWRGPLFYE